MNLKMSGLSDWFSRLSCFDSLQMVLFGVLHLICLIGSVLFRFVTTHLFPTLANYYLLENANTCLGAWSLSCAFCNYAMPLKKKFSVCMLLWAQLRLIILKRNFFRFFTQSKKFVEELFREALCCAQHLDGG